MSIARMLTQTATITDTPKGSTDAEGNWVPGPGPPATSTEPCRLQHGTSEEVFVGADRIIADALLFLGPATAITGRSEVTVDGKRYQVVGRPAELRTPRGVHHLEVHLRRVDG